MKKTTVILTLCLLLFGCGPGNQKPKPQLPFQCLSSQSTCQVTTKFGLVLIKFNTDKVLTELPFSVLIELQEDVLADSKQKDQNRLIVKGYMEGKTMFMGKIPLFFQEKANDTSIQQFVAETMLGSCSEELMTWRLWLTVEHPDKDSNNKQTTFFIDFDSTRF